MLQLLLLVFLVILLSMGVYFSAAEMAFASLNRARIKSLAEQPGKRGRRAHKVSDLYDNHFDETISTLLIGNNLVAMTSATVSVALFTRLVPGAVGYFLATAVISAIVIVFTDIIPKSITKEQPENVAIFIVPTLGFIMAVLKPLTWCVVKIKDRVSARIAPRQDDKAGDEQSLLSQELVFMVEEAEKGGTLGEDESHLITNAIEFKDVLAWDIHTPRVNIVSMPITATVEEAAALFLESGHSRIPVYEDSLDSIVGIVHLRDFIKCVAQKGEPRPGIRDVLAPAIFTVTSAKVTDVLTLLKQQKHHMAIIMDEYGGTEGLVTMEDLLEQLVGEIWDETDEIIEEFVKLGDGKYKVLCNADIDRLFEIFDMEQKSESNTVGGWIMDGLRRVPEVGDTFSSGKLLVTVTKASGRRAEECIVELAQDEGPGGETH